MRAARSAFAALRVQAGRIASLEWAATAAAAPFLIFPSVRPRLTVLAMAVLVVLWALRLLARREPWPVTPFSGPLLLLGVSILASLWASTTPEFTLAKAAGLVLGLAVFRATALAVANRRSLGVSLVTFCLVALVMVTVGALAAQWLDKVAILARLSRQIPRLISSLPGLRTSGVHPNQIAGLLTLYVPLAVVPPTVTLRYYRGAARYFWMTVSLVFVALVGGALLLTQSRSGWIGAAAGLVAMVALAGLSCPGRWQRALGVSLPLLVLLSLAAGVLCVGPQALGEALYGRDSDTAVEAMIGTVSIAGRVEIWGRSLSAIEDFPLTGCGLGSFRQLVRVLYPLSLVGPEFDIGHAHNVFLQTALDVGLPGLIAYLSLLVLAIASCWRWARLGSPTVRSVALALAGGLVGLHVYGLTDALALGSKPGVAFWMTLGLVASLEQVGQREGRRGEEGTTGRSGLLEWVRARPAMAIMVVVMFVVLVSAGVYLGWRAARDSEALPAEPSIRLPLPPDAVGAEVGLEQPPVDSDWVGLLETATYSTTHSTADVVSFYSDALAGGGWHTEMEVSDASGWSGIYWRDQGRSICLLNVFDVEGVVWVSIVCGDKSESLEVPPLPPPATPDEP